MVRRLLSGGFVRRFTVHELTRIALTDFLLVRVVLEHFLKLSYNGSMIRGTLQVRGSISIHVFVLRMTNGLVTHM